jgi:HK97 gp10 family phage protein
LESEGLSAIGKALYEMEEKLARQSVIAGLRAGARVYRDEAKKFVPVRRSGGPRRIGPVSTGIRYPGYLQRGIIYRTVKKSASLGTPRVVVGPRRSAFYGYFFETGRRSARMPIRRFLTKAFRSGEAKAMKVMTETIWKTMIKKQGRA